MRKLSSLTLFALGIVCIDIAIDYILAFPFAVHYLGSFTFELSNGWYWQIATDGAFWDLTSFLQDGILQYLIIYFVIPALFYSAGLLLIKVPFKKMAIRIGIYLGISVLLNQLLPFTLFEPMRVTLPPILNLLIISVIEYFYWFFSLRASQSKELKSIYLFALGAFLISLMTTLLFSFPRSIHFLGNFQFEISNAWFWEFSLDGTLFYYLNMVIPSSLVSYAIIFTLLPIPFFIIGQLLIGNSVKIAFKNYLIYGLTSTLLINVLLVFFVLPSLVLVVPPILLWLLFLLFNFLIWKIRVPTEKPPEFIVIMSKKTLNTPELKFPPF